MLLQHPQVDNTMPAPISALTTSHASAPTPHLCIQSLCSSSGLKICLQHHPQPPLRLLPPAPYHPYTCVVPSRHASDAPLTPA
ncbi:hypothetical protein O181_006179 [Austropuccinia psidii MF-1]|uniref:Uncharacterized protein n=1 Tax=Austropuccinia psidii MF-1 TaxID=1389203 RepID=A0A9Q3GGL4_9BASI|nr:hypothetical protein [Austropuccinia psidii MF-1]